MNLNQYVTSKDFVWVPTSDTPADLYAHVVELCCVLNSSS